MLKRKLLLADDSITIQKVVNLTFADEGIEVISVGDGDSAMEKVRREAPDLILADVNMPGLSGYQICEQIKQSDETRKIPVILLVGSFEPFDESEAYRVGADDYLTKPFQSIRQLVTKVSDLLESAAADEKIEAPEPPAGTGTQADAENDAGNVHFFNTVEIAPETQAETAPQFETARFGDAGMDDEMIQTSQVGSLPVDEIQKFIADSTAGIGGAASADASFNDDFDSYRNVEPEDDFGKTEPLDIEDLRAFSMENAERANGAAVYEIAEQPDDSYADVLQNDGEQLYYREINQETDQEANRETNREASAGAEDEKLRRERAETESSADSPGHRSPEAGAAFAPPYSEAPDFLFDDLDLLELPPIAPRAAAAPENESRDEYPAQSQSEAAAEMPAQSPAPEFFMDYEKDAEFERSSPLETDAARETSDQTEIDRQIAALSPELIEAIARRVAETMSDKAIREIAWEVVPQMTDLIVRRMAEEKFKE